MNLRSLLKPKVAQQDLDLEISKRSFISSVDALVAGSAEAALAWGLIKTLFGAHLEVRKERTINFLKKIIDNPEIFTEKIVNSEEFRDGLIFTFEKYLFERNKIKRDAIFNIFKGYAKKGCSNDFKLEKFLHTLSLLTEYEAKVLKIFVDGSIYKWLEEQKIYSNEELVTESKRPLNVYQLGKYILSQKVDMNEFEDEEYCYEVFNSLINLGVITQTVDTMGVVTNSYKLSSFGDEFVKYATMGDL